MKRLLVIPAFLFALGAKAQVYTHPTTGIALEYVGSCEVATCTGTYYDDGGVGGSCVGAAAGNYSNNINWIYRVFCPNAAGQCLTATFSTFCIEGGAGCPWDIFRVANGSTQNSPLLFSGCGAGAIGPFTGTANGCLSFRFKSDATVNRTGWAATFSCAPCGGAPTGTANNDCVNWTLICASLGVPSNSQGPGIVAEACGGGGCPAGGENYTNWYAVCFTTGGTFNFTIIPSVGTDDYDYAVYGPNTSCAALGPAIRCSDAGTTGVTGLSAAAGDLTENVLGDGFTAQMNVNAGECYYIMVDEWTPTGAGYTLSIGGTATTSCVALPVELVSFDAKYNFFEKQVEMDWTTATEVNNDYFAVERSLDGIVFETIGEVDGNGTTSQMHSYKFTDPNPFPGEINYYRLRQVDFDGKHDYSDIQAVVISDFDSQFSVAPNPTNTFADIYFNTAYDADYRLDIYDYTAKLMLSYSFKSVKGKNKIPLDLKGFHKGIYFVNLQGRGDMLRTSFIKE